jgi:hypothetical protein
MGLALGSALGSALGWALGSALGSEVGVALAQLSALGWALGWALGSEVGVALAQQSARQWAWQSAWHSAQLGTRLSTWLGTPQQFQLVPERTLENSRAQIGARCSTTQTLEQSEKMTVSGSRNKWSARLNNICHRKCWSRLVR